MASELVQRFRNDTAPRLLAKFANGGTQVVVRSLVQPSDPLLPPVAAESREEFNAYAKGVSAQMVAADPNLVATDLMLICAAIDYQPSVDSVVAVNGAARRIVKVSAIPEAGDPAIYKFYVR